MATSASGVKKNMLDCGINPIIIAEDPFLKKLDVVYPNEKEVNFGNELTPLEVKDQPQVKWEGNLSKYYLLIMLDPDAPDRRFPMLKEVNHWLVGNILGNNISSGDIIAEYMGSGPPKRTGLHRYVFLVFEQGEKLTFNESRIDRNSRAPRLNFNVRKFCNKYNLGKAIAGNYFQAKWDPYVDQRNSELSRCSVM